METERHYCLNIPERKNTKLLKTDIDYAIVFLYDDDGSELSNAIKLITDNAKTKNMNVMNYILAYYEKGNSELRKAINLFVKELMNLHRYNIKNKCLPELKTLPISNLEKQSLFVAEEKFRSLIDNIIQD